MKASIITAVLSTAIFASAAHADSMDDQLKSALQDICYSSLSNSTLELRKTAQSYRLSMKKVANGVVCNGNDIGTFAAENGADRTANLIRTYQEGNVQVQDLVKSSAKTKPKA
ncbi:DUF3718 domain-containing protein [Echinimonas agarilytica]|uniref:DUF3718 domain-containing protein n=1 Tax=Echinimonas agarilytica TaxID=1215918 RepID=A0AA41W5E2_9GAMM|nr:DUF3718 domain-containing protein [Echinimonas agarilytica]MCM2679324.1 DUF3718 domain-containing protein [Echinimonas agarilytica]